jgi:hypothetical protein
MNPGQPVRVRNLPGRNPSLRGETGVIRAVLNPWKASVIVTFANGTEDAFEPHELEALL